MVAVNVKRGRSMPCILLLAVLIATVVVLCVGEWPVLPAEAKECKLLKSARNYWKHSGGSFQRERKGSIYWYEFNGNGVRGNRFIEQQNDKEQILLMDEVRGLNILLRNDLCAMRNRNEQNFQQLYKGTFIRVVDCT